VDFPDPDRPTSAVQELRGIEIEMLFNTSVLGLEGYRKFTLVSFMGLRFEIVRVPLCSCDPSRGRFAREIRCVAVSREVLICGTVRRSVKFYMLTCVWYTNSMKVSVLHTRY
jgi:hypothetical protein